MVEGVVRCVVLGRLERGRLECATYSLYAIFMRRTEESCGLVSGPQLQQYR